MSDSSQPCRPATPAIAADEVPPVPAVITLAGTWTLTDGAESFTLLFTLLRENTFHARYTDAPDPSVFLAQVITTARGTLLSMVQTSPERQYVAAYSAHRLPSGAFAGSWTDVDGHSAEFQLTPT